MSSSREAVGVSVYLVTNKVNGKQYVGYTTQSPQSRWTQHKTAARGGSVYRFSKALRKHGEENFDWQVVSVHYTADDAKRAERALIAELDPQYNMTPGGDGTGPHTAETRAKMSASHLGKTPSPEAVKKSADSRRGLKQHSDESRAKMSATRRGQKSSEETKAKLSVLRKGVPKSPEHRAAIGAGNLGKIHGVEARANMSAAHIGKPGKKHSVASKFRMKSVAKAREQIKRVRKAIRAYEMDLMNEPVGVTFP